VLVSHFVQVIPRVSKFSPTFSTINHFNYILFHYIFLSSPDIPRPALQTPSVSGTLLPPSAGAALPCLPADRHHGGFGIQKDKIILLEIKIRSSLNKQTPPLSLGSLFSVILIPCFNWVKCPRYL